MASGMVVPVSGPFAGSLNANLLGAGDDDGFRLILNVEEHEVNDTDPYARQLIECAVVACNWRCRFTGLEWKAGLLAALKTFGTTTALFDGLLTPDLSGLGAAGTGRALSLVLNSILGPGTCTPQTLTASQALLAPNHSWEALLTSRLRLCPLEFVLLPYEVTFGSATHVVPFTTSG